MCNCYAISERIEIAIYVQILHIQTLQILQEQYPKLYKSQHVTAVKTLQQSKPFTS